MAKESTEFILNSLRGRILLAVGALIVFNCFCGLLGYFAVSFVAAEPIYAVMASAGAMAAATAIFGWWLSAEILKPIEAVSLLARSLERSPSASLPKTTGAIETDELLRTLHRNSQQLQNLISLMDDVASGKTEAAMAPLQNPDRLSVSFQKLVSKVTESIKAKQQLDALQNSVNRLKSDVSGIRSGNLSIEFRGDLWQVSEVAEAFKYLLGKVNELVSHVSTGSIAARGSADEALKTIRSIIESDDSHSERLERAAEALSSPPEQLHDLTVQLKTEIEAAAESFKRPAADIQIQTASIARLRGHLSESKKHLEKVRERTSMMPQAARSAQELARRSNLVALNTSIQSNSNNGNANLLADEITSLSIRAGSVGKEIVAVNDSINSDLLQLDASLAAFATELAEAATAASHSAESNGDLQKHLAGLNAVQIAISANSAAAIAEHAALVKAIRPLSITFDIGTQLKESEQNLDTIVNLAEGLQEAVSVFRNTNVYAAESRAERSSPRKGTGLLDESVQFAGEN